MQGVVSGKKISVDSINVWLCDQTKEEHLSYQYVNSITKPSQIKSTSCVSGTKIEQNAVVWYHQFKDDVDQHVDARALGPIRFVYLP